MPPTSHIPTTQKKQHLKLMLWVIGIAIVIAAAVTVAVVLNRKPKQEPEKVTFITCDGTLKGWDRYSISSGDLNSTAVNCKNSDTCTAWMKSDDGTVLKKVLNMPGPLECVPNQLNAPTKWTTYIRT